VIHGRNDERLLSAASKDRHVERIDHEFLAHVVCHRPTNDAAAADIENNGDKKKARVRRNVGDICDP